MKGNELRKWMDANGWKNIGNLGMAEGYYNGQLYVFCVGEWIVSKTPDQSERYAKSWMNMEGALRYATKLSSAGQIMYKKDPVQLLKDHGISSYDVTKEKGYSPALMQKLRDGVVSIKTIEMLCDLLNCQPGDLIEYKKK